jgi:hypothetical protein
MIIIFVGIQMASRVELGVILILIPLIQLIPPIPLMLTFCGNTVMCPIAKTIREL